MARSDTGLTDVLDKYFAGIGARDTPETPLRILRADTTALHLENFGLRSGGSGNADLICEEAMRLVGGRSQIFLPWRFDGRDSGIVLDELPVAAECYRIAESFHHNWPRGKDQQATRRLLARNVLQVLGPDLASPSMFLLLWARRPVLDASGRLMDCHRGTGMAVRVAYAHRIPAFNLAVPAHARRVVDFCRKRLGDDSPLLNFDLAA